MMDFREAVLTHVKAKEINGLKKILNEANGLDIINIMDEMSNEEIVLAYRLLNKDLALEVFEGLDLNDQQWLIKTLTETDAVAVFNELAPDDRVRLLDELPAGVAKRMLASLDRKACEDINLLMGFAPETAGRLMTPEYVRLRGEWTAGEALEKVRAIAKDKETIYTLFVTDDKRKLEGVISLRDLFIADEEVKITDIMTDDVVSFDTSTDQEEVAKSLQILDLLAVPIVDKENRLVGIITVDDAMDILQDEATEDILAGAGLVSSGEVAGSETMRSVTLIEGSMPKIWRARIPFLVITMVAGFLAAGVMDQFEDILESVAVVAIFIPIIMDMGGTIGTQSATIFTRGILLGHIQTKSIQKHILKEVLVGISLGTIIGVVTGAIAYFWQGDMSLALALGLALVATMTLAAFLGFTVPYVLMKLNLDQATGTGPLITSIKDISGLFIYFGLIALFLGVLTPDYEVTGMFVEKDGIHYFLDMEEETALVIEIEGCEVNLADCDVEIPEEIEISDDEFEVIRLRD
ncbi:MAG: magnesium transporter [Turicibacter sp.]|nr:magnesium transporter [Turicibacter sp.]